MSMPRHNGRQTLQHLAFLDIFQNLALFRVRIWYLDPILLLESLVHTLVLFDMHRSPPFSDRISYIRLPICFQSIFGVNFRIGPTRMPSFGCCERNGTPVRQQLDGSRDHYCILCRYPSPEILSQTTGTVVQAEFTDHPLQIGLGIRSIGQKQLDCERVFKNN